MNPADTLEIRRLRVTCHIGVPAAERAHPQTLWLTLRLEPTRQFDALADDLNLTLDYHAIAQEIQALAAFKPRHLIETLAVDCARFLLERHPLQRVAVTVEKHILPDTECVAVHVLRQR